MLERWHWNRTGQPEGHSWQLLEQCQRPADHCQQCPALEEARLLVQQALDKFLQCWVRVSNLAAPPAALLVHSASRCGLCFTSKSRIASGLLQGTLSKKRITLARVYTKQHALFAMIMSELPFSPCCSTYTACEYHTGSCGYHEGNIRCMCSDHFNELFFQGMQCGASTGFKT